MNCLVAIYIFINICTDETRQNKTKKQITKNWKCKFPTCVLSVYIWIMNYVVCDLYKCMLMKQNKCKNCDQDCDQLREDQHDGCRSKFNDSNCDSASRQKAIQVIEVKLQSLQRESRNAQNKNVPVM